MLFVKKGNRLEVVVNVVVHSPAAITLLKVLQKSHKLSKGRALAWLQRPRSTSVYILNQDTNKFARTLLYDKGDRTGTRCHTGRCGRKALMQRCC